MGTTDNDDNTSLPAELPRWMHAAAAVPVEEWTPALQERIGDAHFSLMGDLSFDIKRYNDRLNKLNENDPKFDENRAWLWRNIAKAQAQREQLEYAAPADLVRTMARVITERRESDPPPAAMMSGSVEVSPNAGRKNPPRVPKPDIIKDALTLIHDSVTDNMRIVDIRKHPRPRLAELLKQAGIKTGAKDSSFKRGLKLAMANLPPPKGQNRAK